MKKIKKLLGAPLFSRYSSQQHSFKSTNPAVLRFSAVIYPQIFYHDALRLLITTPHYVSFPVFVSAYYLPPLRVVVFWLLLLLLSIHFLFRSYSVLIVIVFSLH
ncbi:hypothetical protein, unlikely [Trypanosoma brucei gambiense DAL972]|uniref:Uncharacterized protein n=1 Tax=Trypanosoma brucei gambiense (strain MHOM/CI/86/DAL972) TaxID=679716 RepID=D0A1N0_TRYB9|nr:hypothetical protein, unlikely [Trypanosoma brucei gambiense DAL972]CBH15172.1 hypothetical protein, unlikely [Trypanosoma brucei gambiense DAL972]|eukprot:XP_011777438.1 hypothetical protein, unlikely [Trypanosoma brucei gambiense DAL972]